MTPIESFVGSVIETLCMFMLMNLFRDNYLKSKWKIAVAAVLFALVAAGSEYIMIPTILTYVINFGVVILTLHFLTKISAIEIFFENFFAFSVIVVLEMLLIYNTNQTGLFSSLSLLDRMLQLVVILVVCSAVALNPWVLKKIRPFYEKYKKPFYLMEIDLFIIAIVTLYIWDEDPKVLLSDLGTILIFTIAWFAVNFYLLNNLVKNSRQKQMLELHNQYMEMSETMLSDLHAKEHEYKRHLQTLRGMCEIEEANEASDEIIAYIDELFEKGRTQRKQEIISTGNGVVDAFLYMKNKEAENCGIEIAYLPTGSFPQFPCENYELIEILGNLVDNSLEYLKEIEFESTEMRKKTIYLRIDTSDGKSRIEVSSPYLERNEKSAPDVAKKGYTTKGANRGYGLYNVKTILEKYKGKLELHIVDEEFVATALF